MKCNIILTVVAGLLASTALAQGNSLTVAIWGGSYQDAQSQALFAPYEAATGNTVKQETYGPVTL